MKYIFVFNLVVFNLKHSKIKKVKKSCVFACVYERRGEGDTRNPPGSQGGPSLEKFGNHWARIATSMIPLSYTTSFTMLVISFTEN